MVQSQGMEMTVRKLKNSMKVLIPCQMMFSLSSPNCAKILINCLRNIETQVKDLYDCFDVLKNSHIKGEKQLDSANESIKHLSDRFDAYEERDKQNKKIKVLEEKVEKLENENKALSERSTT